MDDLCKIDDFWIRFVSVFLVLCQHFRASTTQNDLRATLAPRVLSSLQYGVKQATKTPETEGESVGGVVGESVFSVGAVQLDNWPPFQPNLAVRAV